MNERPNTRRLMSFQEEETAWRKAQKWHSPPPGETKIKITASGMCGVFILCQAPCSGLCVEHLSDRLWRVLLIFPLSSQGEERQGVRVLARHTGSGGPRPRPRQPTTSRKYCTLPAPREGSATHILGSGLGVRACPPSEAVLTASACSSSSELHPHSV